MKISIDNSVSPLLTQLKMRILATLLLEPDHKIKLNNRSDIIGFFGLSKSEAALFDESWALLSEEKLVYSLPHEIGLSENGFRMSQEFIHDIITGFAA